MEALEYMRPTSVRQACDALIGGDGSARVLAGGTDLLVQMKQGAARPATLVSLRDVPGLRFVRREEDGGLTVGATTRLADIEAAPAVLTAFPALAEAASCIGSVQVRDRATIGGNLCNAAPSADTAPILIAYESSLTITDGHHERMVPLEEFFTGPGQTVLRPGEIVATIHVPPPPPRSHAKYYKTFRSAMDCCTVGVAVLVAFAPDTAVVDRARVVLGAIAPTPIRARRCEEMLIGKELDGPLMAAVGALAAQDARPISDVRSSAEYRLVLAEVLTRRALAAAGLWVREGVGA